MDQYAPHTIIRLSVGDERIATGRILRNKCILQVKPNTYKMYLNLNNWTQDICPGKEATAEFESPTERKQRIMRAEQDPARYDSEPRDIHTVRNLYEKLDLSNTLTLKDKPRGKDPCIYVQIGDVICPLYFQRKTGSVIVRLQDGSLKKIQAFHDLSASYNEIFFYKTGDQHVLKRILP